MTERLVTTLGLAALLTVLLAGCGQSGQSAEKPDSVRVTRFITPSGDRIVSYQAFYDDGVVTYHDYEPFGDVDLVSSERGDRSLTLLVRDGFEPRALPVEGPGVGPIDEPARAAFATIARGVDVSTIPWTSNAHGDMGLGDMGLGGP